MERTALDRGDAAATLAFEYAPNGLIFSERRIVRRANSSFANMFEFDPGAMPGLPLVGLYPSLDDFVRIGDAAHAIMKRTGKYEDERVMIRRGGQLFRCRVSGTSLTPDDPFASAVWSFADVSTQWNLCELSGRNRQIVLLISQGKSAKEVARLLGLSPRTVETYLARIRKKLSVKNAAELISRMRTVQDEAVTS